MSKIAEAGEPNHHDEGVGAIGRVHRLISGGPRQIVAQTPFAVTLHHAGRGGPLRKSDKAFSLRNTCDRPAAIALRFHLLAPLVHVSICGTVRSSKVGGAGALADGQVAVAQQAAQLPVGKCPMGPELAAPSSQIEVGAGRPIRPPRRQKRAKWKHGEIHHVIVKRRKRARDEQIRRPGMLASLLIPALSEENGSIHTTPPLAISRKV